MTNKRRSGLVKNERELSEYLHLTDSDSHVEVSFLDMLSDYNTGGSCLSQIFWEHENQSGLLVIWLIYIKLYRKKETKFWKKNPG